MKQEVSLNEMKEFEFDILVTFKKICEKYKLRYSLAYGTLLGAVRHSGFIPWDDDVDIMMPRDDYQRFLEVIEQETKDSNLKIAAPEITNNYLLPLAKLYNKKTRLVQHYGQNEGIELGVYIDIFVVDGLPDVDAKAFYKRCELLRRLWALSIRDTNAPSRNVVTKIIRNIVAVPFHIIGANKILIKYVETAQKYSHNSTQCAGVVLYGEGIEKEIMPREAFDNMEVITFEGEDFLVIDKYENYLKNMYGDYMKLPPIDQRVSKHPHDVYWM